MTRDIKFRLFDKTEKKMKEKIYTKCFEAFSLTYCLSNEDDYEVMQYTGLKDKNGVELYEGDIIKGVATMSRKNKKGVVRFMFGMFMGDGMPLHNIDNCEVIGNIYENPELIKGE